MMSTALSHLWIERGQLVSGSTDSPTNMIEAAFEWAIKETRKEKWAGQQSLLKKSKKE